MSNNSQTERKISPLFSLIPLVLFFVLNKYYGIFVATASLIVTSVFSALFSYFYEKKINNIAIITAILALIFGGLTIILQDDSFIKIKVTLINILFAIILIIGLVLKKNFLKLVLGKELPVEDKGWDILKKMWIGFFIFFAIFNEVLWRNVSTDTWVNFKVFVFPILTLVFAIIQLPVFKKYMIKQEEELKSKI